MVQLVRPLLAGSLALALAGCGGGATTSAGSTSNTASAGGSTTSAASSTSTSTTAATSSTSTAPAPTAGQQIAGTDFAAPIRTAVNAVKSYSIEERRSTDPAPSTGSVSAFGTDAMVFQMEMPGVMSMRYLDGNAYVRSPDLGPKWVKFRKDSTQPEVQQMLASVTSDIGENHDLEVWENSQVTFVGAEPVGAHYKVVAPADRFYDSVIDEESTTENGEEVNTSADKAKLTGRTVTYDVWLDGQQRPARIKLDSTSLSGLKFSAMTEDVVFRSTTTFSKWGEPVTVQAPPAAQTTDADELAADGAFGSDPGETSAA
ncbi:hypothetical protein [Calidifontibacter indicus]|uniref:hypothetical protein n=1 Tax=Calidifontibacter indicus TaxID=419650 RepID=UPI003D762CE2